MTSERVPSEHFHDTGSVSVVIPTRGRPEMVRAAVVSAFAQTMRPLEVIVVVDGPEDGPTPGTAAVLSSIKEPCLRMLLLKESAGGAAARNRGVEAARGEWIAFLDDDDLWLPEKLSRQMAAAALQAGACEPVIACRVIARAPAWEDVWPRTPYEQGKPMGEYLFCRRGWRYGEALLQTSTILARRRFLLRQPFAQGLPRHQDWDWLVRVAADPMAAVQCLSGEPLAVFHIEGDRASVSRVRDWRYSRQWAEERQALLGNRAVRGFLATECAAQAQAAPWPERLALLLAILRHMPESGRGAVADLSRAAVFLLVSQRQRRGLRDLVRNARRALSVSRASSAPKPIADPGELLRHSPLRPRR